MKFTLEKKECWDDISRHMHVFVQHQQAQFNALHPFELMFGRKAVLPIDIDMEKKDPEEKLNPKSDKLSTPALVTLKDRQ